METKLRLDHLKGDRCIVSIEKNLLPLTGIEKVDVLPDQKQVSIVHTHRANMKLVKDTLKNLGYPETGTTKGITRLIQGARSYINSFFWKLSEQ
jgi:copper chaperone